MKKPYLHLLLVVWLLAACSQQPTAITPTSEINAVHIVLPKLKPKPGISVGPAALATGVLTLDGNCIRLKATDGTSSLIIWAIDVKLEGRSIVNTRRMQQIFFGDTVSLGGGTMPDGWQLSMDLQVPLDKNCHGPYWMATNIVE